MASDWPLRGFCANPNREASDGSARDATSAKALQLRRLREMISPEPTTSRGMCGARQQKRRPRPRPPRSSARGQRSNAGTRMLARRAAYSSRLQLAITSETSRRGQRGDVTTTSQRHVPAHLAARSLSRSSRVRTRRRARARAHPHHSRMSSALDPSALPPLARALLVEFLALRDVVALLSCSRALRLDVPTAQHALRFDAVGRHFGRGCTLDWAARLPVYLANAADEQASCALLHENERAVVSLQGAETASLLSLLELVASQLGPLLYNSINVDGVLYTPLPFVWPPRRVNADTSVETEPEDERFVDMSAAATPLALHFENVEVSPFAPHTVVCAFCEMVRVEVEKYTIEGFEYLYHRDEEASAAGEQLRALGYDEHSEEWAAVVQRFNQLDALYDEDAVDDEDGPEIFRRLMAYGEVPVLARMEHVKDTDEVGLATRRAICEAAREDFAESVCLHLCERLRWFYVSNGFDDIRHEAGRLAHFPDILVERISAVAPSGFTVGVYIVSGENVGIAPS